VRAWVRRWLLHLLADDIELIVNRALVESICCCSMESDTNRRTWGRD
jgi:hypothetical protein